MSGPYETEQLPHREAICPACDCDWEEFSCLCADAEKTAAMGIKCKAQENGEWCRDDAEGNQCPKCEKERSAEADYWLGQWKTATFEEKYGREKYEAELRDAGRNHDRR